MADMDNLGTYGENLSIMIPTYNCAAYLRETLETLKAQGDILRDAQIEVIDDVSTRDDPEAVVREVWGDKATFYRHSKNQGACANFNACIERAKRPWIHILHGDDYVLPGAYEEFRETIASAPGSIAAFARVLMVDKDSHWQSVSESLGTEKRGPLPYDVLRWRVCPVQFAGVLFSRKAVQQVGNFDCAFTHAQDWNLWWRIAKTGKAAYSNTVVGAYRIFEGNHTSSLLRTGKNLEEYLEQLGRLAASFRENPVPGISVEELYRPLFFRAYMQAMQFARQDKAAFAENMKRIERWPSGAKSRVHLLRLRLAGSGIGKR